MLSLVVIKNGKVAEIGGLKSLRNQKRRKEKHDEWSFCELPSTASLAATEAAVEVILFLCIALLATFVQGVLSYLCFSKLLFLSKRKPQLVANKARLTWLQDSSRRRLWGATISQHRFFLL